MRSPSPAAPPPCTVPRPSPGSAPATWSPPRPCPSPPARPAPPTSGPPRVYVDIDPTTLNLDPGAVPDGIAALVAVHYAGLPVDLAALTRRPRVVIEDAAHALGARTPDGPVGNCARSDMTCFSFHPVKSITTGEGGAVTTNDDDLADRLRALPPPRPPAACPRRAPGPPGSTRSASTTASPTCRPRSAPASSTSWTGSSLAAPSWPAATTTRLADLDVVCPRCGPGWHRPRPPPLPGPRRAPGRRGGRTASPGHRRAGPPRPDPPPPGLRRGDHSRRPAGDRGGLRPRPVAPALLRPDRRRAGHRRRPPSGGSSRWRCPRVTPPWSGPSGSSRSAPRRCRSTPASSCRACPRSSSSAARAPTSGTSTATSSSTSRWRSAR